MWPGSPRRWAPNPVVVEREVPPPAFVDADELG